MTQHSLFEPIHPNVVEPAATRERLLQKARHNDLVLGTCTWTFPGWAHFYSNFLKASPAPQNQHKLSKAAKSLAQYARALSLNGVCIDHAYYRPVDVSTFKSYASVVPESFRFTVKAFQEITRTDLSPHSFLDASLFEDACWAPALEGLGSKLGYLLLQFSAEAGHSFSPQRFAGALTEFLHDLKCDLPRIAVEIRAPTHLTRELIHQMRRLNIPDLLLIHPSANTLARQLELFGEDLLQRPLLIRWMLHPDLSYNNAREAFEPFNQILKKDEYTRTLLKSLIALRSAKTTILCNNKAEGSSPLSLYSLMS